MAAQGLLEAPGVGLRSQGCQQRQMLALRQREASDGVVREGGPNWRGSSEPGKAD